MPRGCNAALNRSMSGAFSLRSVSEVGMGDVAAIIGVVLLLVGVLLVALRGHRRLTSWTPYVGIAIAVIGMGVEVVGAVVAAG